MRNLTLAVVSLVVLPASALANDYTYEGTWRTTNRKLDGTMTCIVSDLGNEQWRGRFYGVWHGVNFEYPVTFTGPPSKLQGTAIIDGAHYSWKGEIATDTPASFKGTFGGSRYTGSFDLKEKSGTATRKRGQER